MYSLFQHDNKPEYGVVRLADWTYLRDGLQRNLDTVLHYYRNAPHSVMSDHLLVRILQSIGVPMSLPVDRYYSNVYSLAYTMTSAFQLTSPTGSGKIFNGTFYGKGNQEVIVVDDEWFLPEVAEKNWQNLVPVKVLRHPFSDIDLTIPDGKMRSREQGVAVMSLNITLLAIMYRAFAIEETRKAKVDPAYVPLNIMQFIYMYVLPNMLASHLDYALFNRAVFLSRGLVPNKTQAKHPFPLIDYSKQVNAVLTRVLGLLKKSTYSFDMILATLPAVGHVNQKKALVVPDVVPTRQVLWSVILARLPALQFLISIAREGGRTRDQDEIDEIGETLAKLQRQKVFESTLPPELYKSTMDIIFSIIQKTSFTQFDQSPQ